MSLPSSYAEREDFAARRWGILRIELVDHLKSGESSVELASLLSYHRKDSISHWQYLIPSERGLNDVPYPLYHKCHYGPPLCR
jgi:hypothetical protein